MILSHPESDHLNGLVYLLENFKVEYLVKNTDTNDTANYKKMIRLCREREIKIITPPFFPEQMTANGICLTFFNSTAAHETLNNRSLVFKLGFEDFSFLFPGDILKEREFRLAREYGFKLKSDVLMAPHHGSSTSSTQFFLDKVEPESVIIPCGWQNRYRFPHPAVLNRYREAGIKIYRTDKHGAVFTVSAGNSFHITTYKDL